MELMNRTRYHDTLPDVFSAAGSMVPEPSINPPPMPFIEVVTTGCEEAEYMATGRFRRGWDGGGDRQAVVAPAHQSNPGQVVGEVPSGGASQVGC